MLTSYNYVNKGTYLCGSRTDNVMLKYLQLLFQSHSPSNVVSTPLPLLVHEQQTALARWW